MEDNVKQVSKLAPTLGERGMDVHADRFIGRRWGVKLLDYTIDSLFWQDFRTNLGLCTVAATVMFWFIWGQIQAKREEAGERKTTLRNKMRWRKQGKAEKAAEHAQELEAQHQALQQAHADELEAQRNMLQHHNANAAIPWTDLVEGRRIGGGSFGEVKRATWSGNDVAIKFPRQQTAEVQAEFEAEVALLLALHHPNIVRCYGHSTSTDGMLCIVTELCPHGSLEDMMYGAKSHPAPPAKQPAWLGWMKQVAEGMKYLHDRNVLHRDLKPGNVLVSGQHTLRICDFGLSKVVSANLPAEIHTEACGTAHYSAPEVTPSFLEENQPQGGYGKPCDVYSYGVLINEIAAQKQPWLEINAPNPMAKIIQIANRVSGGDRPEQPQGITPEFDGLVGDCWGQAPHDRPSFGLVLERLDAMASFMEGR